MLNSSYLAAKILFLYDLNEKKRTLYKLSYLNKANSLSKKLNEPSEKKTATGNFMFPFLLGMKFIRKKKYIHINKL